MQNDAPLYSYQFLYNMAYSTPAFIRNMITLFTDLLGEYIEELETVQQNRDMEQLRRLLHKLKPNMSNMEIKKALAAIELLQVHTTWNAEVTAGVEELQRIFRRVRPLMLKDLETMEE